MTEPDEVQHIRQAQETDLAFVADCTRAAYQKYVERLGRAPQPATRDYRDAIAEGQVWLLEDGGSAVGLLVVTPEPECLLIYSVAVDPAHQSRGHGRRLMGHAVSEARRQGLQALQLYTNERMSENIALYRSLGYRETRREPFKGSQVVHMSLELDATDSSQ